MRKLSAAAVGLLLVVPSVSFSGTVRPWAEVNGTVSMYSMSDVNDDISSINAGLAGSGLKMDEIHNGLAMGGSVGMELPSHMSVGAGYDRLFASSEVGDATGSVKYNFPANAFRAFAHYSFTGIGTSGAYVGGSAGMVQEAGDLSLTTTGSGTVSGKMKGSGALFELFTGGDFWTSPRFGLTGTAGYRYAKIGEVKLDGTTMLTASGDKASVDYSGAYLRAGVKVGLGQ